MPISKVIYEGRTLIDLTSDTVTAEDLSSGVTAHDAKGNLIVGTESETSSGMSLNVFTQENEPEAKDGVWIQTNNRYKKVIVGTNKYQNIVYGSWEQLNDLPISISNNYSTAVVYKGHLHLLDGTAHYVFDGSKWEQLANVPVGVTRFCGVYKDKIYMFASRSIGTSVTYYLYMWNDVEYEYIQTVTSFSFSITTVFTYNDQLMATTTDGLYTYDDVNNKWTYQNYSSDQRLSPNFWNWIKTIEFNNRVYGFYSTSNASNAKQYCASFDGTGWKVTDVTDKITSTFVGCCPVVYQNKIHILSYNSNTHYTFDADEKIEVMDELPFNPQWKPVVVYDKKIYILGPNNSKAFYRMLDAQQPQYIGANVIIYQDWSKDTGEYGTKFISDDNIEIVGDNNRFPSGFDDVFYIDKSGNVEESPTYYGDGTQWVKFKN